MTDTFLLGSNMTIEEIRRRRNVPAKRGGRVRYHGGSEPQLGTITGARDGYLQILLDGDAHPFTFHPRWMLDYLDADGAVVLKTRN